MKPFLLFIFLSIKLGVKTQHNYRFSVGGGFHSMMFWGLRSFEDVVCPKEDNDVYRIYEHEVYNVDYGNFLTSKNYSINFSINWINQDTWLLKQTFSFFKGTFRDQVRLTLTGHGEDTAYHPGNTYTSSNVTTGNVTDMSYITTFQGYSSSLIALRKTRNPRLKLGVGLFFIRYYSYDGWWQTPNNNFSATGYRPIYSIRANGNYFSNQLGLSLNLNWSWKLVEFYLNIGNSIFTTKKEDKKGYIEWKWNLEPYTFFPTSHNFDYRFPLTFETGIAFSFDRIKK